MAIWYALSYTVNCLKKIILIIRIWLTMQTYAFVTRAGWAEAQQELDYQCHYAIQGAKRVPTHVFNRNGSVVQGHRQRLEWKVGIAYNTFQPLNMLAVRDKNLRQMFAHWGVYIRESETKAMLVSLELHFVRKAY